MTAFKIDKFGGQLPAWDDHLLPDGQSANAVNCYLFGGNLTGWRQPKLLHTLNNSAASYAYRLPTISQSVANATLTFLAQPNAGDTVSVGETVYTFRTAVAAAEDVLIGATVQATATNLFDAIVLSAQFQLQTDNPSPSGSNLLSFTPGTLPALTVGMSVVDASSPSSIPNGTTIGSFNNTTGIVSLIFLSVYVGGSDGAPSLPPQGVSAGDTINFGLAGQTYGVGTTANAAVDQTGNTTTTPASSLCTLTTGAQPTIYVQAPSFGAAYNSTPLAESTAGARTSWSSATMVGGSNQTFSSGITGASQWLEFLDPDTNVVRSPVVDDTFQRYYFASPSLPPMYNTTARIAAGNTGQNAPWLLGLNPPGCAPVVTLTGGGSQTTLGNPTVEPGAVPITNIPAGSTFSIPFIPAQNSTLNGANLMTLTSGSGNAFAYVCADGGNTPGELLWLSEEVSNWTAGTTTFFPPVETLLFDYQSQIFSPGVTYWLCIVTDTAMNVAIADSGTRGQLANPGDPLSEGYPVHYPGSNGGQPSGAGTTLGAPPTTSFNQPDWQMWVMGTPCNVAVVGPFITPAYGPPANTGTIGLPITPIIIGGFSTSVVTNLDNPGSNTLFLIPVTSPGVCTVYDIALIPQTSSLTANLTAVIYADDGGVPGQLLESGEQVTGLVAGTTTLSTFATPYNLLANVPYWIGFITDTTLSLANTSASSTGSGAIASVTYSNGAPLTAPAMTAGEPNWQMWADLTTGNVGVATTNNPTGNTGAAAGGTLGTAVLTTRAYVYTWVTAYGEESAPSPATVVTGWSNSTWTVSLFTPPPDDMGVLRNITNTRIYRTVTASGGGTTYFFVALLPVATVSYADTNLDSAVALNLLLASTVWFPPPENLQGLCAMPNGMTVGFVGNEIWFSEPYYPHAWPPNYVITTEFPVIGIGVSGQCVVACTAAKPYVMTGVNPSNMTELKVDKADPCISRGSIVGATEGVYYASPNGLMLVSPYGQITNMTELWVTREKWQQLTPQKNVRAIGFLSQYFAFGTVYQGDASVAQQGFTIELAASDTSSFTIWPQPGGHRLGLTQLTAPNGFNIKNVMTDPWTGVALLVQNGGVYYYDFSDPAPTIVPYRWRSKVFQDKRRANYSALRVWYTAYPGAPAQGAAPNTAPATDPSWLPGNLGPNQYAEIRIYAGGNEPYVDGQLVTAREIFNSGGLLRIASGFKFENWQVEIEGRVSISNVQIGTSVTELGKV